MSHALDLHSDGVAFDDLLGHELGVEQRPLVALLDFRLGLAFDGAQLVGHFDRVFAGVFRAGLLDDEPHVSDGVVDEVDRLRGPHGVPILVPAKSSKRHRQIKTSIPQVYTQSFKNGTFYLSLIFRYIMIIRDIKSHRFGALGLTPLGLAMKVDYKRLKIQSKIF